MNFEHRVRIPADRETVWNFLMDIEKTGTCIPGVEEVRQVEPDNYIGVQKVRVGPIGLKFEGKMTVTERDKDNWHATMKGEGADKRAGGAVKATINMSLTEVAPNETELLVNTDANVLGKLGEFGQPVMRKKADQIMREFGENISKRITAGR